MGFFGRETVPFFSVLLLLTIFTVFVLQLIFQAPPKDFSDAPQSGDVAVLGGGTTAILTALEASGRGAEVYLFPMGQELGGDAAQLVQEGLAAAGTSPQEERGLEMTPQMLRARMEARGQGLNVPALLNAFAEMAPRMPDEAARAGGIEFDQIPFPEEHPYLHLPSSPRESARAFKEYMLETLQQSPVFLREKAVEGILLSPRGEVEALLLKDEGGEEKTLYVRAVVLAAGGYSAALDHWHDFATGEESVPLRPEQTGRGLLLAEALGAEVIQEGYYSRRPIVCPLNGNEAAGLLEKCAAFFPGWLRQTQAHVFHEEGAFQPLTDLADEEELLRLLDSSGGEAFLVGGASMQAAQPGPEGLWREYRSPERLLEGLGGREAGGLPADLEGPYFAASLRVGVDYTMGGLPVTPRGEVQAGDDILEGLYAAGEIAGGLHGAARLPGTPLSEALFFARVVGEEASAYAHR